MNKQKITGLFQMVMPLIAGVYFWNYGIDPTLLIASLITGYLFFITTMIGYHRILSHRIVKTGNVFKTLYSFIGSLAFSSPPAAWATMHIIHHKYSDSELDPHSPVQRGLFGSAIFYFHQSVDEIIKGLSSRERRKLVVNVKHLRKDSVLSFFEKYYLHVNLLYATILFLINPTYVIYFYVVPVTYSHVGQLVSIVNHGGFLGGENNNKNHKGHNKFLGWWLFYGEHNHSDHHDNPSRDDELNIMLRRVFDGQSSR